MTGTFPGESTPSYRVDLAQGHYLLVYQDIAGGSPDPGSRATYSYETGPGAMPVPAPGATVTVEAVTLEFGALTPEVQTHAAGQPYDLALGGCSFAAFDIRVTFDTDPATVETYTYLPDLGLGFLSAYADAGGSDTYPAARIFVP